MKIQFLSRAACALCAALALFATAPATAQQKIKVGLMLPYSGTYAALGNAITNGFKLAINEAGGKFGGHEIEYFTVDDESEPAKAPDNVNKLIKRDNVDVVVGTVHSGVAIAMGKAAAVPQCGISAVPNRDRVAQAGRGVRFLRRRGCGEVREGLRGGGVERQDSALRSRISHRRDARGARRRGAGPVDDAALCGC